MKRLKSGFTLAEVLITLGIIGVVAALVMPSVMTNYTYKVLGVKLSKFASQLEAATRPYVVQNEQFKKGEANNGSADILKEFLEDSFLYSRIESSGDATKKASDIVPAGEVFEEARTSDTSVEAYNSEYVLTLKDGTSMIVANAAEDAKTNGLLDGDSAKVGQPAFTVRFFPNVNGIPTGVQRAYDFVVTELGYVYGSEDDACLTAIINSDYNTKSSMFKGTPCYKSYGSGTDTPSTGEPSST